MIEFELNPNATSTTLSPRVVEGAGAKAKAVGLLSLYHSPI